MTIQKQVEERKPVNGVCFFAFCKWHGLVGRFGTRGLPYTVYCPKCRAYVHATIRKQWNGKSQALRSMTLVSNRSDAYFKLVEYFGTRFFIRETSQETKVPSSLHSER